jgi:hypothetical protein
MLDITSVVKEFSAPDLQAFINEYSLGDLVYKNFFPSEFTPNLTFEALQAQFGAKVAADVVAMDSRAPRKGRQLPGKTTGDIPKVEIARPKKETDLNVYRQLVAAVTSAPNAITRGQALLRLVNWMYDDTTFVLNGVNARMEWMAKQIASTGKYKLTIANNEAGIVTPVEIKFGIPTGNIVNSATNWWAASNVSKPISDIKALDTTARAAGFKLQYLTMDKDTFNKMVLSDEVQKFAASYVANALGLLTTPNLQIVNQALANEGLPQIRIWDSIINIESKAGVYTSTTGWEPGNVTATVTNLLGKTQWTTPADSFVSADVDKSTKAMNDFVLVKAYAEQDPISVMTKGVAYATPVLEGANSFYILKTKQS